MPSPYDRFFNEAVYNYDKCSTCRHFVDEIRHNYVEASGKSDLRVLRAIKKHILAKHRNKEEGK